MNLLGTILLGLIVGALARGIMPGKQPMGWIVTCVLGIAGSVLAGAAGQWLGWYGQGQAAGWLASVAGALALLFVVGLFRGRSAS